jgi:hypothetical protein
MARFFTARGPTLVGNLRIVPMPRRGLSVPQIIATLRDELESAGDREQARWVVNEHYVKTRDEAALTFNAAIFALALAD